MDFTNLPRRNKAYAGANGSKISVDLNGELYMLKFPAVPSRNKTMLSERKEKILDKSLQLLKSKERSSKVR